MKKSKLLALLLAAAMLCGAILPGLQVNAADGDDATGDTGDKKTEGVELVKTVEKDPDGDTYTVHLEAYATGESVTSVVKTDIPTDVILVLDQSGSMADAFTTATEESWVSYGIRSNSDNYDDRINDNSYGATRNLWYKRDDGAYVEVSVDVNPVYTYTKYNSNTTNRTYYYNATWYQNVYAYVDGEYVQVTVTRDWNENYTYSYNGVQIATSSGNNSNPAAVFYQRSNDYDYEYTYYYFVNGVRTEIGKSEGQDTLFQTAFYKKISIGDNVSRLDSLRKAAQSFADAVAEKAKGTDGQLGTDDDIAHRIAVIGFASQNDYGNNSELLSIAGTNSGSVGIAYDNLTTQNYKDVLQDVSKTAGKTMVDNAIDALAASGATRIDLGMEMAKKTLDNNPLQENEKRNRVVVVFTDGSPTNQSGFQKNVANTAIATSDEIKAAGATVYSIGVFSGADATSAGQEPNGNLQEGSTQLTAACNWFMQKLSSNNGTPQNPSYYLSASDTLTLNRIFEQISQNIETGGSTTELDSNTVVRDIMTPQFELASGDSVDAITVWEYNCTGVDAANDFTWDDGKLVDRDVVKVTIDDTDPDGDATTQNNIVNVTGFDFKANWVGKRTDAAGKVTYSGKKLVIEFKIKVRDGFLGGNDVPSNEPESGIYKDKNDEGPLEPFDKPEHDIELKNVEPSIPDSNVYLGAYVDETISKEEIERNSTIKIGDYTLNFSEPNYGLPEWASDYIDIVMDVVPVTGTLDGITEDVDYKITVTVKPKNPTAGDEDLSDTATGTVHVFKPELTYKDSDVYYGADAPTDFDVNQVSERWVNAKGDKYADDEGVTMMGDKPALDLSYTPDATKIDNGKIATKQDIPVNVKVEMAMGKNDVKSNVTEYTTFKHQDCDGKDCTWKEVKNPADGSSPAFLLHVKTCDLTITKTGGADGEPYVFNILRNGQPYTQATIVGNNTVNIVELPVGIYTVQEDMGWSWRYQEPTGVSNGADLSAEHPMGTITVTNTLDRNLWLNGYSEVIRNTLNGPTHNN